MRIPFFRFWAAIALLTLSLTGKSQSLDSFPENPIEFVNTLGAFLTAHKSEEIEKVFKAVEPALRSGAYAEAEFALILFAGMLMLYAPLSPWLPILGSLLSDLISLVGLAFAIAGLIRCFKKES